MAARNLAPVRTLVREMIPLVGSFAPNGAGTVALTSRRGLGFTVVRTSTGLFTVTLTDKYASIVSATATVQSVAAAARFAQIGTISGSAVQIRTVDGAGVVQDIAADANSRVHFVLCVRNSAATPTLGG